MSALAPVKTQVKIPATQGLGFAVQPRLVLSEREGERPDLAAQMESATRLGHSLRTIRVSNAAPSQIQASSLVQRQSIPEEKEEEEEELQMQREPAALQRQENLEEEEEEMQMRREPAAIQRQEIAEEEEEELQMKRDDQRVGVKGGKAPPNVESAINRARGGGRLLDSAIQMQMGESLGHDFSRVRVHTDAEAYALNEQLDAKAFATGRDIFFRQGEYNPSSSSGRKLLAHELSHVVQQHSGRVSRAGNVMTVQPGGDAFDLEADRVAEAVISSINSPTERQIPYEEFQMIQKEEDREEFVTKSALEVQPHPLAEYSPRKIQGPLTSVYSRRRGLTGSDCQESVEIRHSIQRKVNNITGIDNGQTYSTVDKSRGLSVRLPDAIIEFEGENIRPKSAVKRLAKALWIRRDPFEKDKPTVYSVSNGRGINTSTKPSTSEMSFEDAQWQDDGPTPGNIEQNKNKLTVKDSPGFSMFYPEMSPATFHAEFILTATDPEDQDVKSVQYVTEFTNQSKKTEEKAPSSPSARPARGAARSSFHPI